MYGVLGPNGAGKTTMLKMLATLLPIDGGWARVFGIGQVLVHGCDLMNDGHFTAHVAWALLGCVAVVSVFAPLAVRSYARKM